MIDGFLLGVIATGSMAAAVFFLKFWRETHDFLFLAFSIFFIVEALNRAGHLFMARPSEGNPWIYLLRLFSLVLIFSAILKKNCDGTR